MKRDGTRIKGFTLRASQGCRPCVKMTGACIKGLMLRASQVRSTTCERVWDVDKWTEIKGLTVGSSKSEKYRDVYEVEGLPGVIDYT